MSARRRCALLSAPAMLAVLGTCLLSAAPALAALETPETKPASAVTATTATLNGVVTPGAEATVGYEFAYNTNGTCMEGSRTNPVAEATLAAGTAAAEPLSGLEPNREYTFCLVATHEGEASAGQPVTFRTLDARPVVGPDTSTPESPFAQTLEAQVNPNNQYTSYSFQYATEATGETLEGTIKTISGSGPLSGFGEQAASVSTGAALTSDSTYYFRVLATNLTGTTEGPVEPFTTEAAGAPVIGEGSTPTVTQTTAVLSALVNPEFQAVTVCEFLLSGAAPVPCAPSAAELGEGGEAVGTGATLTGLAPNTEYRYEVHAENATGPSEGPEGAFLTLPNPPTVETGGVSAITANGATVSGKVNPQASGQPSQDATTYYFQYGLTSNYGLQAPLSTGEAGEGTSAVPEAAQLTGLEPGVTYHYRIVASNDNAGTPQLVYGADETFSTLTTPPIVTSLAASSVTQSGATITATLDPQGLSTRYELQLAPGRPEGFAPQTSGSTTNTIPLSLSIGALSPGTVYYYKLIATNANGTSESTGFFSTAAATEAQGPLAQPPTPPLLAVPAISFPAESPRAPSAKPLTSAQRLEQALKACRKDKKRAKRVACEKQAHKKYPTRKPSR
jgi:hypothetical protein